MTSRPPTWCSRTPRSTCPTIFGAGSPEVQQYNADPDTFKDAEIADYIGEAVHCAQGSAIVRRRAGRRSSARRRRRRRRSPTRCRPSRAATPATRRSSAPSTSRRSSVRARPNLTHNGYQVTDATGNLVDLDGNAIDGAVQRHKPGFPGFNPTASQSLAHAGRHAGERHPGHLRLHLRHARAEGRHQRLHHGDRDRLGQADRPRRQVLRRQRQRPTTRRSRSSSSGSPQDGINASNTLFVISAEENDQFDGANAGRALTPTPATCDGVTVFCSYPAGTIGELQANIKGLLSTTASAGHDVRRGAAGRVDLRARAARARRPDAAPAGARHRGDDAATTPTAAQTSQKIVKYQAGGVEERILHMQTADPLRTPSYTLFPVPDYFFSTTGPERVDQPGLRLQPRVLLAEHRRHLVVVRGSGRGRARDRRADAGAEQRVAGPELDATPCPRPRRGAPGSRRSTCGRPCCGCSGSATTTPATAASSRRCWPTRRRP